MYFKTVVVEFWPNLITVFSFCRSRHVFVSCLVYRRRTQVLSHMTYRRQM